MSDKLRREKHPEEEAAMIETIDPQKLLEDPNALIEVAPNPSLVGGWIIRRTGETLEDGFWSRLAAEQRCAEIREWVKAMMKELEMPDDV